MAATPSIGFTSRPPQDPNAMDIDVTWRQGPNPSVGPQMGFTELEGFKTFN